uniref:Uncharacterized protein n=1 Tax=Brassica campestris TaxID=3711 RepID=A0A3P6BML1_BRACM|nr:unnamed protein product [Brassica rapa]
MSTSQSQMVISMFGDGDIEIQSEEAISMSMTHNRDSTTVATPEPDDVAVAISMSTSQSNRGKSKTGVRRQRPSGETLRHGPVPVSRQVVTKKKYEMWPVFNYPESSLPKHSGLTEAAVRKAEHNPALAVKPMMLLLWLGGDAGDPLFVYGAKARITKSEKQVDSDEGAPTKQRRVADHSTRFVPVGTYGDKLKLLEGRVDEMVAKVAIMREVCKKHEDLINGLKLSLEGRDNQKTQRSTKKPHRSTRNKRRGEGLEICGTSLHWVRPNAMSMSKRQVWKCVNCGPVAVKFLEMHATGNRRPTMSGSTMRWISTREWCFLYILIGRTDCSSQWWLSIFF